MATPFVAGAVALMLSANPDLSPDQVADILYSTADPMPGYQLHEVGNGFVNVREAVESALVTDGKMDEFLAGDRQWSSRGFWAVSEETDPLLGEFGTWTQATNGGASGGTYQRAGTGSSFRVIFYGRGVKIEHPVGPNGGVAQVFVDNHFLKTVDFDNPTLEFGHITAVPCQETRVHVVDIRGVTSGEMYVDRVHVDHELLDSNHSVVTESKTITGQAINGTTDTLLVDLGPEVVAISAEISWPEAADVDLYLYDPNGVQISGTEGATTQNPEYVDAATTVPGTYRWEIVGYAGVANYTMKCTQTRLSTATPVEKPSLRFELAQAFPNPFNPSTTIQFTVAQAANVGLVVYDVAGRQVKTLVNESRAPGVYRVTWDGRDDRGHRVASGVYFYRMNAGSFTQTRKMVLLK